jgi:hypothetical protein
VIWSSLCCRLLSPVSPIRSLDSGSGSVSAPKPSRRSREFPKKEGFDGIIRHLHYGTSVTNARASGLVTITSKSVNFDHAKYAAKNVADESLNRTFCSKGEPGQWICWDFGQRRVRPTHYTITSYYLKSWIVEGSVDGTTWTEMDRRQNNQDFRALEWNTKTFAFARPLECKFIRLTQIEKNHSDRDFLILSLVEFFGTLSE